MDEYRQHLTPGKRVELIVRTNRTPVRYFGEFQDINDKCITLANLQNKVTEFNCTKDQSVELYIYAKSGIYKLNCTVLEPNSDICVLSAPLRVEKMQRREYIRVNLKVTTQIEITCNNEVKILKSSSRNISAKGINLLLEQDIAPASKINLLLLFPEGIIETLAQVIKIQPVEIEGKQYFSTSMMFITISEKDMDFIVKKCFEYEARLRRKQLDDKI